MSDKREFSTGSVRDRAEGKGRFDLIPAHPYMRLALRYEHGRKSYGDRNWEKGQPLMESFLDSLERHLTRLKNGDQSEDHAAAIAWNIFGYMHTLHEIEGGRLPAELDDRPARMKRETIEVKPVVRTAEQVNHGIARLKEGYYAAVGVWLAGGCAFCGSEERGGYTYVHNHCFDGMSKVPGLFDQLKAACDAAGAKK